MHLSIKITRQSSSERKTSKPFDSLEAEIYKIIMIDSRVLMYIFNSCWYLNQPCLIKAKSNKPTYHTHLVKYSCAVIPVNSIAVMEDLPPFHFQATNTLFLLTSILPFQSNKSGQLFCSRLWE